MRAALRQLDNRRGARGHSTKRWCDDQKPSPEAGQPPPRVAPPAITDNRASRTDTFNADAFLSEARRSGTWAAQAGDGHCRRLGSHQRAAPVLVADATAATWLSAAMTDP